MGRTSRKNKVPQKANSERIWSTAVYARLSNINNGQETPESLETQIYMLRTFVEQRSELNLVEVYTDNGFSGTNFERPAFEQMLMDVRDKKIDCIVVKDLSRFGRNFVEAGYYIEGLFPKIGVRFIAVNDQYDSNNPKSANSLMLPIRDLLNEYYSRDLSRKVKNVFAQKRKAGESYSVVPFGYMKSEERLGFYELDKEYAPVVKSIFQWKKSGIGPSEIARKLMEMEVPAPLERRRQLGYAKYSGKREGKSWTECIVMSILDNPVYTGDMVYNRKSFPEGFRKASVATPRSEWIITPNVNPPIISHELFDEVYEMLQSGRAEFRKKTKEARLLSQNTSNQFQHMVFCSCCKREMHRRFYDRSPHMAALECRTHGCKAHGRIAVPLLQVLLMDQIRFQIQASISLENMKESSKVKTVFHEKEQLALAEVQEAERTVNSLKLRKQRIYEDFTEGSIDSEDCKILRGQIDQKLLTAEKILSEKRQAISALRAAYEPSDTMKAYQTGDLSLMSFDEQVMREFIHRVEVGNDGSITIEFRYQDQLKSLQEMEETL